MLSKEFIREVQDLAAHAARYVNENERIFAANWNGTPNSASIADAGNKAKAALSRDLDLLQADVARVCAAYLDMKQEDREELRRMVGDYPPLLSQFFNHLGWQSQQIHSRAEQKLALIGLAGISIGDLRRVDTRDLLIGLGQVYVHLYRADVLISVALVRIAEISNPLPCAPQTTSTRDFLLSFEEGAYFKTSIEPKLKKLK